jgi:hypothetical protein
MSNQVKSGGNGEESNVSESYQPPSLTPLGNARDLLAGSSGSVQDGMDPILITRPTGG